MPNRLAKSRIIRVTTGGISRRIVTRAFAAAGLVSVVLGAVLGGPFAGPLAGLPGWGVQTAMAATGINKQINFQGKVVNANGTNVADGSYSFVFRLYNHATNNATGSCTGACVWTETKTLTVTDGIFQTALGSVTSLPGSVDFNTDNIYLGINFNSDGEMSPRIQFTASPYAFNSDALQGLHASDFAQINPSSAQSGSINLTGSVQAGTSVQAPLLDTATAAALNVGTGAATSVTVGRATSSTNLTLQGSASTSWTATGASGTTTVSFDAPTANTTLKFPASAAGTYTICTTDPASCSAVYQAVTGSGFLLKNATDTSSISGLAAAAFGYTFNNTTSAATTSGVLKLDNNSNTGSTLLVTANATPTSGAAVLKVNQANASATGNLIDLQLNSTSKFAVDVNGNLMQAGGSSTTSTINGQTISAAASFTGSVTTAGSVLIQPTAGSTTALNVKSSTALNNNIFTVDTTNARVGVNLGGSNLPNSTLEVGGTLRLSGTATENYATPAGANVPTKINIPYFDPGNFGQILAFGLPSTAQDTSRAMSLFDARTGRHQPTIGVFSPDENNLVGFSWDGSNTTAGVKTNDGGGSTMGLSVRTGEAAGSGQSTGAVTIQSGNGVGTNTSTGNIVIDAGSKTGTGTTGTITIGGTNASGLTLGRTGLNTTVGANLAVQGTGTNTFAGTLQFNAVGTDITTNTNEDLTIVANGTGVINLNDSVMVGAIGASTSNSSLLCRDTSTNLLTSCDSSNPNAKPFLQGGNSFGAAGDLGTNDNFGLNIRTNGTTKLTVSTAGDLTFASGAGGFDQSASTGTFKTGTGAVSLNGDTTVAAGKNLSLASGTGTFAQTYTGTSDAHTITANSMTSSSVLKVTSANNSGTNAAWSAISLNPTNNQGTTAVSTGTIIGLDLQYTQNTSVAGNNETVANMVVKRNDSSSTDATVDSILNLANNDTGAGNQITVTNAINVNGANVTNGLNFTGFSGATKLINSTNFTVSQAGAVVGVGVDSGSGLLQGAAGLTVTGATARINENSNNNTNINTGSSTGTVTIGGGSAPLVIDSTNFDVSSAGALSGITTISTSSTINGQTISSTANFTGTLTTASTLTVTAGGATIAGNTSINNNAGAATTNIGTGTTSGQVTIGGGSVPLVIDSTNFDLTSGGAITMASTINSQTISSASNFTGTVTIQGANALTLGTTGTNTGAVAFKGSTASSGTINLVGQNNPTGTQTITLPDATGTVCLQSSTSCGFLKKDAQDTSTVNVAATQYTFTNSNTGAGGVLSLVNAGTNTALSVTQSGNPSGGSALIVANNSNGTPSGNLMDLQAGGVSKFSVSATGAVVSASTLQTGGIITAGAVGSADTNTLLCRNSSNQIAACTAASISGSAFVQGGNSFTATADLGTNDNFGLNIRTNGTTKLTVSTAGDLTYASGAGGFDQSASTGTFKTGSGAVSINGDTTVASGKSITYASGGAGGFDQSASTGTFKTGSGAVSVNGDTTVAANKSLTLSSGTGVYTQTYTGTAGNAAGITANSLTTGTALKVTAANNTAANTNWSSTQINSTNSQGTTAVTGLISGFDVQFTQNTSVAGNNETVANFAIAANASSSTDATVNSIVNVANNDSATGNQITASRGVNINGANVTDGLYFNGTFGTNLINTSTNNFTLTQAGGITMAGNLTVQGTGNNTLSGSLMMSNVTTDITTNTNEDLTMVANGTGQIVLNDTVQVATLGTAGTATYLCRNGSNQIATCNTTGTGAAFTQGGNSFGAAGDLGTNDSFALNIRTANSTKLTVSTAGDLTYASGGGGFDQSASTGTFKTGTGAVSLNGDTTVATGKNLSVANGTVTVGSAGAGNGALLNNGSTVNSTLALGNFASGGAIGTAAATVDIYSAISVAQTTASQTLTIPTPTASTTYGRMLYISNIGTASFTLLGTVMSAGSTATLVWANKNGGAGWTFAGADGNGILNQNSAAQTANFWINGSGRADTSFLTPLVDTASGVALALGTTNATAINLNQNSTVAATKTLTVTSGATTLNGATAGSGTALTVNTNATTNVGLIVNAVSSQTADLLRINDGTGATVIKVLAGGTIQASVKPTTTGATGALELGSTANQSSNDINGVIGFWGASVKHAQIAYAVGDGFYLCDSSAGSPSGDFGQCATRVNLYGGGGNFNGGLTSTGGAVSLTGNAASTFTTSSGNLTVDSAAAVSIGATNATSIGIGKTGITTTVSGTTQLGASAGAGALVNNGTTVNTTLALGNFASGGAIGTAAATVDIYTAISVAQTTTSQTLTIPSPTANTVYGRTLYISNIGTASFTLLGTTMSAGSTATLVWANKNGGAGWTFAGADGNGILNQNSTDQTADFRITGTGRANTSFTGPLFDALSGGALNVGTSAATGITIGKTGITTQVAGTLQLGAAAGSGAMVNNGSTVNSTLALSNFASGGSIGTAAATVDIYTSISVAQTTASQTLTIPNPTANTTYGRMLYLSNIGSQSFTLLGTTMSPGSTATLMWANKNGGAGWAFAGADGNGILNQTAADQAASYRISGTGVLGGGLQIGGTSGYCASGCGNLNFASGSAQTLKVLAAAAAAAGDSLTIQAGTGGTGTTAGGNLVLQGGAAGSTGTVGGVVIVKSQTNSTTAFMVQNSSGTAILTVDTSSGSGAGTVLIGDSTNGASFGTTREVTFNGTARHSKTIKLNAEYVGAVLDADGSNNTGTMTAAYDSTQRMGYYKWTTGQASAQDYDIVITMPVPDDWAAWTGNPTFKVYTSGGTGYNVTAQITKTDGTNDASYNAFTILSGSVNNTTATWLTVSNPNGATYTNNTTAPALAGSGYTAGGIMNIRIHLTAAPPVSSVAQEVRVGDIYLPYLSKW